MDKTPRINQKAPQFSTTDIFGDKVNLGAYKDGYTLLVFLRYSGCPWCNLAIHRLSLEYKRLQEYKCQIIAFVQSDKAGVVKNIYERHELRPQFPIIADHDMRFYEQYGVDSSIPGTLREITKIPY